MYFHNGCTRMSPYSVIVLLGSVIKNLWFKVQQLKNQARMLNYSGNVTNMPNNHCTNLWSKFPSFHKKPYYYPTLIWPIQSLSCDVCESSVCLCVPSRKIRFPVDWRLLCKERIPSFCEILGLCKPRLMCIMGELAEEGLWLCLLPYAEFLLLCKRRRTQNLL